MNMWRDIRTNELSNELFHLEVMSHTAKVLELFVNCPAPEWEEAYFQDDHKTQLEEGPHNGPQFRGAYTQLGYRLCSGPDSGEGRGPYRRGSRGGAGNRGPWTSLGAKQGLSLGTSSLRSCLKCEENDVIFFQNPPSNSPLGAQAMRWAGLGMASVRDMVREYGEVSWSVCHDMVREYGEVPWSVCQRHGERIGRGVMSCLSVRA